MITGYSGQSYEDCSPDMGVLLLYVIAGLSYDSRIIRREGGRDGGSRSRSKKGQDQIKSGMGKISVISIYVWSCCGTRAPCNRRAGFRAL